MPPHAALHSSVSEPGTWESSEQVDVLKGHGFSRAIYGNQFRWALAPEGWFSAVPIFSTSS
jgi:hypothetical protein